MFATPNNQSTTKTKNEEDIFAMLTGSKKEETGADKALNILQEQNVL